MQVAAPVAIGTLGGTITMTGSPGSGGGVVPTLGAGDLVAAVPQLAGLPLTASTLATVPSASLDEPDLRNALLWADGQVRDGAAGVVLVQGTDTLEETAYYLDLWWEHDAPLVVTGAMRAPHLAGPDGAANLLASVITAASAEARGRGVLVVLDDEVHAAAWVVKRDASATGAFCSPSFGPAGRVVEGRAVLAGPPGRRAALLGAPPERPARVALVTTHLGDDGRLLELVAGDGYAGVVLAALGVGHVSARCADVVGALADRLPVVLASRTGAGSTWRGTYGFPGSEEDLLRRGALGAGWLTPPKARLLLSCLLGQGLDRPALERAVADRSVPAWEVVA